MLKRLLKYLLIAVLTFVIGLALYLVVPSPWGLSFKIEEFPAETPIAVDLVKQCSPNTAYVAKPIYYSDREVIDARCFELQSRIVGAAHDGDIPGIRAALQEGANIHSPGPSQSGGDYIPPLTRAVQGSQPAAVKLLLDNGGDVNESHKCCMSHTSLLMTAIETNDVETTKLLISRGADLNFEGDFEAWSVMDQAEEAGHQQATELFFKACEDNLRCRFELRTKKILSNFASPKYYRYW